MKNKEKESILIDVVADWWASHLQIVMGIKANKKAHKYFVDTLRRYIESRRYKKGVAKVMISPDDYYQKGKAPLGRACDLLPKSYQEKIPQDVTMTIDFESRRVSVLYDDMKRCVLYPQLT